MHPIIRNSAKRSRTGGSFARALLIPLLGTCACIAATLQAASHPRLVLTASPGFTITWDGNNGGFSSPEAGAGPSNNVALASNGTTAIGSSEFGSGVHLIENINDGLYGNSESWISAFTVPDLDPWIGLAFPTSTDITAIAWGRDNGNAVTDACGAACTDRNVDTYTLQYTQAGVVDGSTPDTGDAATGWGTIGTIQILGGADDSAFIGYLRHRYEVSEGGLPVTATGFRIKVADPGTALDEIEINPIPDPVPPIDLYLQIAAADGYSISWDENEGNFSTPDAPAIVPANIAQLGVAFGTGTIGAPHAEANVIDAQYGNANSWISAPTADAFIGINFGQCIEIQSIAWGRDNGNATTDACGAACTDRNLGTYTLQITARTDATASTPETGDPLSGWVTVGTVSYLGADPVVFQPHLRHRFDLSAGGQPIRAAAIRIKVSDPGTAIDEIEINANQILEQDVLSIVNGFGYSLTWDLNQGDYIGAAAPDNRALASNGSSSFGSTEFGAGVHLIENINDGLYGNSESWLANFTIPDPDPYIAVSFGASINITNLAFSRNNTGAGFSDRSADTYTIQITEVATPDGTTTDTGDASTGWATVATLTYALPGVPGWLPHLRHRLDVDGPPIAATAIRVRVGDPNTAIDELEVNTAGAPPAPPEPAAPIVLTAELGYTLDYDGNDGEFENSAVGAAPPTNRALASEGTVPFASSELAGFGHFTAEINDGLYGNLSSWISGPELSVDPDPWIALNFGGMISITNIAWGRDNGDFVDNCCGGTAIDRAITLYTLQHTLVANPDGATTQTDDASTGWQTIGTVDIQRDAPPLFHSYKRHRFEVGSGGFPIEATGIRIKVASNGTAIDEIEVNTAGPTSPTLSVEQDGTNVHVTWIGNGTLEGATSILGPWFDCLVTGAKSYTAPIAAGEQRYFRLRH